MDITDNQQKEEEELLEKYLSGDNRAFGPLYYRYRDIFFYHLNKQHPYLSQEDKEDLAIDFLGRISSRLVKYDKQKSLFRTWMTTCILNHLHEYRNKRWTEKTKLTHSLSKTNMVGETYEVSITSNDNPIDGISYMNIIKLIKQRLGEDDWKIFELHFIQGYNQLEVGKKLGLRECTMWYRIKRIRKKLDGINNIN